jgi:heme-binding protein
VNRQRIFQILRLGLLGLLLIQFVPLGHTRTNPPTVTEPNWSNPWARALVKEHCFQCHSNETHWAWYSNIAPGLWLIAFDVIEGRQKFNFSDWNRNPGKLDEMIVAIQESEMPPVQYWIIHPSARIDTQQKQDLIHALEASVNNYTALDSGTLR